MLALDDFSEWVRVPESSVSHTLLGDFVRAMSARDIDTLTILMITTGDETHADTYEEICAAAIACGNAVISSWSWRELERVCTDVASARDRLSAAVFAHGRDDIADTLRDNGMFDRARRAV